MGGMAASDLTVRELAEHLAERLGAMSGTHRLELIFRDGRYVDGYHQERLNPKLLEELQAELQARLLVAD